MDKLTNQFLLEMQKIQLEENESLDKKETLKHELAECEANLKKYEDLKTRLRESLITIENKSAVFVKRRNELINKFNLPLRDKNATDIAFGVVSSDSPPQSLPLLLPLQSSPSTSPYPTTTNESTLVVSSKPVTAIATSNFPSSSDIDESASKVEIEEQCEHNKTVGESSGRKTLIVTTQMVDPPFLNGGKALRNVTIESGTISITKNINQEDGVMDVAHLGMQPISDSNTTISSQSERYLLNNGESTNLLIDSGGFSSSDIQPEDSVNKNLNKKRQFSKGFDAEKRSKRVKSKSQSKKQAKLSLEEHELFNIEISIPSTGETGNMVNDVITTSQAIQSNESGRTWCSSPFSLDRPFNCDDDPLSTNFHPGDDPNQRVISVRDPRISRNNIAKGICEIERIRVSETDQFAFRSICFLKSICNYIYVSCRDGTVKRYNIHDYKDMTNYSGHTDAASTLSIDLGHALLFTGSKSGHFRCYRLNDGDHIGTKFLNTQIQTIFDAWGRIFVALTNGNVISLKFQNNQLTETNEKFKVKDRILSLSPIFDKEFKLIIALLVSGKPIIIDASNGSVIKVLQASDSTFFPAYIETNQYFCITATGCSPAPLDVKRSVIHVYDPHRNWSIVNRKPERGVITATHLYEEFLYAAILIQGVTRVHCYSVPDLRIIWVAYHNMERVFGLTVFSPFIIIGSEAGEILSFTPDHEGPFFCHANPCSCSMPFARRVDIDFHLSRYFSG